MYSVFFKWHFQIIFFFYQIAKIFILIFVVQCIGNLYIFPLISTSNIDNVNKLSLILKIISQSNIMILLIKTIASVLNVSTDIIPNIRDHFFSYLTDFSYFPLKIVFQSCCTRSEQVKNERGCRWFHLFFIDFSYFIFQPGSSL